MNYNRTKTIFSILIIFLITLSVFESCSIFGIEKITIRQSEFTHTDKDILFQGKLYSINVENDDNIIFPIHYKRPTMVPYNVSNRKTNSTEVTDEYQPTILFLTNGRFILNMGCTIYGKLSKYNDNSFDIIYIENSYDCQKKEFNKIETLVIDALKASNKCIIGKRIIYFKRNDKVLMVYSVI